MTSRDFCYWLQGHLEISETKTLSDKQVETIKRHLSLVFKHEIDPSFKDVEELRQIHTPTPTPTYCDKGYSDDIPITC